jgi:DNA polymerase III subunit alpha
LLIEQGYIEYNGDLKETYENIVGIYNLERNVKDMWEMVWEHKIQSLFQMEKQSGIQGIALTKPESVDDLATLNSVIRLMAQEKGAEQPLSKFARFKEDINLWYQEMEHYGLTEEEQKVLEPIIKISYGICESQEGFMQLVQMPECGGFDLTWADRLRKSIAKKNPADYEKLQKEYFAQVEAKGLSKRLCNYVWNVLVATSRGYGFNKSHTLAYSLIALQEMNLAYKYPTMFWNCACLIADSGGAKSDEDEDEIENGDVDDFVEEIYYDDSVEEFGDEEEDDEDDEEEVTTKKEKKKKKKANNYGKIAAAIGKIQASGIPVTPPNINKSRMTFSPDIENNTIRYGFSGITRISEELIKEIIANRPYSSMKDFLSRIKLTKPQIINLIKSGALDEFGDRMDIMHAYVDSISGKKDTVNLRNLQMIINYKLLPEKFNFQIRCFNYNKYLKKLKVVLNGVEYFALDNTAIKFFEANFDVDQLIPSEASESGFAVKKAVWEKIYKKQQDIIRPYVKEHCAEIVDAINTRLFNEMWEKYCKGNLSKWEMDSISFYSHEHELAGVDLQKCGFDDFNELPDEPEIDKVIYIKGKQVPLFKISRICGTVLDRDKNKKIITLLTTSGVVTVRLFGDIFTHYDRQISEIGADGKKHVKEKSVFTRGNKIVVSGIKREDTFTGKKYARTPWHMIELIEEVNEDGTVVTRERVGAD